MPLKLAVYAAESSHTVLGKKAFFNKVAIEHGSCVTLAEHQPVAVRIGRIGGIHVHPVEIQSGQYLAYR